MVVARSPIGRLKAFADERGWRGLRFVRDMNDRSGGRGADWYPKLDY